MKEKKGQFLGVLCSFLYQYAFKKEQNIWLISSVNIYPQLN